MAEADTSSRPVVVTVFNQKGGVGKTTTAVNVAICLAAFGRQVALLDFDSQSNATANVGVTPQVAVGAYHVITGHAPFDQALRPTPYPGLRLVGGSDELAWADIELALGKNPEAGLLRALQGVPAGLDFVVVDCPPAPGIVSVNALVAADVTIMPVMPSPHALDGLHRAWRNLHRVRNRFSRDMGEIHILLTMTEDDELPRQLSNDVVDVFGGRVMPVLVPRDAAVLQAAGRDLPVAVLDPDSAPARAYVRVAELLLQPAPGGDGSMPARDAARAQLARWHDGAAHAAARVDLGAGRRAARGQGGEDEAKDEVALSWLPVLGGMVAGAALGATATLLALANGLVP